MDRHGLGAMRKDLRYADKTEWSSGVLEYWSDGSKRPMPELIRHKYSGWTFQIHGGLACRPYGRFYTY
jgi:hypothetical protein